jgi:hypothetical protein
MVERTYWVTMVGRVRCENEGEDDNKETLELHNNVLLAVAYW